MGNTRLSNLQRAAMKHNQLIGLAVAIRKNAVTISDSATVTPLARGLANGIVTVAQQLEQALRAERKD